MPGQDLNLELPTLSDPLTDIVEKLVTALQIVEDDLAPKIDAGSLAITTPLSLGGAPLLNAGGVRLAGGVSDEPGTVYVDTLSDLHIVTAAGDVQLTEAGVIKINALGTIGGDYGGSNPASLNFIDANNTYEFKDDITGAYTDWADIKAAELRLVGPSGIRELSVVGVDSKLTVDGPVDVDGALTADSVSTSGAVTATSVTAGTISVTTLKRTRTVCYPAAMGSSQGCPYIAGSFQLSHLGGADLAIPLEAGELFDYIEIYVVKSSSAGFTARAALAHAGGSTIASATNASAAPGAITITLTSLPAPTDMKGYLVNVTSLNGTTPSAGDVVTGYKVVTYIP